MNLAPMLRKEWTDACGGRGKPEERLALNGKASLQEAFVNLLGPHGEAA